MTRKLQIIISSSAAWVLAFAAGAQYAANRNAGRSNEARQKMIHRQVEPEWSDMEDVKSPTEPARKEEGSAVKSRKDAKMKILGEMAKTPDSHPSAAEKREGIKNLVRRETGDEKPPVLERLK